MRPTDQNQTASRRPNLMSSSRRTGAEMNILAMLDGQTRKPSRLPGLPKAAWYGGGGVLACALVATVAWLVHDQAGSGFEGRVPAGPPVVALEIAPETLPNPALHVDPPRMHGAAVVNIADVGVAAGAPAMAVAPAAAAAAATPHLQSDALTLGDTRQGIGALPAVAAAAVSTVVATAVPAAAAAPVAAPVAGSGAVPAAEPATASAAPPALVPAAAPASKPAKRSVHASPRILAKAAPSAPRHALAETRREPSAHPRRMAALPKPKTAPAAVDTDVALISAIIQHVNQRGEPKDAASCSDKPCAATMKNRP